MTERLRLRAWEESDLDAYARIVADPEVMRHMGAALDREAAARQMADFRDRGEVDGLAHWAAADHMTGELIGRIGLLRHEDWPFDRENVEVGWLLGRRWWGRGLATEGARACVRHAFEDLGLARVISLTLPENWRSRRVMERLGMSYRGREHWREHEHVWYAVNRPRPGP